MKKIIRKSMVISSSSFIITLLFGVLSVTGAENEYDIVAGNFLKYINSDKSIVSTQMVAGNALDTTLPEVEIAYLANLSGGGYILISVSKDLTPVKAYSLNADFLTLPDNYRKFLLLEMEYNIRTVNDSSRSTRSAGLSETEKRWDFLLNLDRIRAPLDYIPDTFLLTTKWNQSHPYNKFLPEIGGEKVVSGCVNVAMAQMLKYHNHPLSGKGVVSYEWNGQILKAVLFRSYLWENMPNELGPATPQYLADEVALLIRDLAIMNETQFNLDNSSASPNIEALISYLGYSNRIESMENTNTDFFTTLTVEIDAERPVLLSFPGHLTVADGYSSDGTGKKIHVNMGWGGHDDDYYYLDQIVSVQDGNLEFNPDLTIYYNIVPCSTDDCFVNLDPQDSIDGLTITGNFDHAKDVDRYEVYLSGDTTIEGTRGYIGQQVFYISIYDSDRQLVISHNDTIIQNLPDDRYTLRMSIFNESGSGYTYDSDYSAYTVTIATDDLTNEAKAAIDADLEISPVIYNDINGMILNSTNAEPYHLRVDVRDENGDTVQLSVGNTNNAAVQTSLTGSILALTPVTGAAGTASKITIKATANGKVAEKSFNVLVTDADLDFGKTFEVSGIFENQEDFNKHRVVLDGTCSITGYNGYSSQAFYSSVMDSNENVIIQASNIEINSSFTRDFYLLGASLKQNPGGFGAYYDYEAEEEVNDHQYLLSVQCPDADDNTATIATLLGIDLSGTDPAPGDINDDGAVDLIDSILSFQILSDINPGDTVSIEADANGDNKIGLQEATYILQKISGQRE